MTTWPMASAATPLRSPNTPATARLVGEGIRKVFQNVGRLDVSE